jgi:uncharacterized protein involved in outer membrane biogenesis
MIRLSAERVGQVLSLRRWLLTVGLLVAIYAGLGFLLVPYVARSAIEKYVVQDLGRRVAIGKITFNPFTFTTEVTGFSLSEANGTPIASFDRFRVNAQISSIFNRAWTFAEVRLDHPSLNVLIDSDGALNLTKLQPTAVTASTQARPFHVPALRIATLAVREGHIGFEDHSRLRGTPFSTTLAPIEFTLTDFRTTPDFQSAYNFEGSTTAGEHLRWSGQLSIQPLGSTGRFAIANLKATTIAAYFGDALEFNLRSGSIDVQGEYRVAVADKLRLNLDLPQARLHDLTIAPKGADAATTWVTLPAADFSRAALSLQDRTVSVERIQIDNAKVSAWRETDGQLNLFRLFNGPPAGGNSVPPVHPNAPVSDTGWAIDVKALDIRTASIDAEDRMVQPPVRLNLTPVTMNISGYSTKPGNVIKADISLGVGANGRLTARGDLSLVPFASNLALEVADIDLAPLQPYLDRSSSLQLTSGKLSLKGTLNTTEASQGNEALVKIAGDLAIADVAARDKASRQSVVNWQLLRLAGVAYSQNPDRLDIERVEAHRPYARVIISEQRTLNLVTALNPSGATQVGSSVTAPTTAAATTQAMPVRIRSVVIQDGSSDFSDLSVEPNFSATVMGLNGGASGLSSDSTSRAEVKISGNVDRYAPVDITGRVNLLSAALFTDITASFRNMELTTFNPYSGKYAGYSISKGKLTTELHYLVQNRKLDAQHHIVLDQIEFGAATESKDKVSLPVRLAAALLKDRHGVIDINLPVTGSLDDPEFRVGPLVWKAFVGLITKSATAPFRLLGSLFGRGEEIAFIDFTPGSATLRPDQAEKISALAKALVERPQLRLDVPLQTLAVADDEALERAELDVALTPLLPADRSTVVTQEQRLAALAQLYQQLLGAPPVYPSESAAGGDVVTSNIAFLEKTLRPRFSPTPDRRGQLARARADIVQAAVLANSEIVPERVFLTERESGKTSVPGAVRMEFRLE